MKLKELGALAGLDDYSALALAIKRFGQRLQRSRSAEKEELRQLCQMSRCDPKLGGTASLAGENPSELCQQDAGAPGLMESLHVF